MANRTIENMRKHLIDLIYSAASVEGIACTFADTKEIVEGKHCNGVSEHDLNVILGLKDAWNSLFDNYRKPIDFDIASQYNYHIENRVSHIAGKLRTRGITISGSSYVPPIPRLEDFDRI